MEGFNHQEWIEKTTVFWSVVQSPVFWGVKPVHFGPSFGEKRGVKIAPRSSKTRYKIWFFVTNVRRKNMANAWARLGCLIVTAPHAAAKPERSVRFGKPSNYWQCLVISNHHLGLQMLYLVTM